MSLLRSSLRLRLLNQSKFAQFRKNSSKFQHTDDDWKRWKNIFFFGAIPTIVVAHVSAFVLPDESDHEPPPYVEYDHLRIRTKRFPWGDGKKSLIHNPRVNALPGGYEEGYGPAEEDVEEQEEVEEQKDEDKLEEVEEQKEEVEEEHEDVEGQEEVEAQKDVEEEEDVDDGE